MLAFVYNFMHELERSSKCFGAQAQTGQMLRSTKVGNLDNSAEDELNFFFFSKLCFAFKFNMN